MSARHIPSIRFNRNPKRFTVADWVYGPDGTASITFGFYPGYDAGFVRRAIRVRLSQLEGEGFTGLMNATDENRFGYLLFRFADVSEFKAGEDKRIIEACHNGAFEAFVQLDTARRKTRRRARQLKRLKLRRKLADLIYRRH